MSAVTVYLDANSLLRGAMDECFPTWFLRHLLVLWDCSNVSRLNGTLAKILAHTAVLHHYMWFVTSVFRYIASWTLLWISSVARTCFSNFAEFDKWSIVLTTLAMVAYSCSSTRHFWTRLAYYKSFRSDLYKFRARSVCYADFCYVREYQPCIAKERPLRPVLSNPQPTVNIKGVFIPEAYLGMVKWFNPSKWMTCSYESVGK